MDTVATQKGNATMSQSVYTEMPERRPGENDIQYLARYQRWATHTRTTPTAARTEHNDLSRRLAILRQAGDWLQESASALEVSDLTAYELGKLADEATKLSNHAKYICQCAEDRIHALRMAQSLRGN